MGCNIKDSVDELALVERLRWAYLILYSNEND